MTRLWCMSIVWCIRCKSRLTTHMAKKATSITQVNKKFHTHKGRCHTPVKKMISLSPLCNRAFIAFAFSFTHPYTHTPKYKHIHNATATHP